jgi:hypothetical protein
LVENGGTQAAKQQSTPIKHYLAQETIICHFR